MTFIVMAMVTNPLIRCTFCGNVNPPEIIILLEIDILPKAPNEAQVHHDPQSMMTGVERSTQGGSRRAREAMGAREQAQGGKIQ